MDMEALVDESVGPEGYYGFLLGRYGEMPDDVDALKRGLRRAIEIIGSYELDCRGLSDYLRDNPTGQGFCQGQVYQHAVAGIFAEMAK